MKGKLTAGLLTMLLMLPMLIWIPPVSAEPEEPTWQMYRPKLDPDHSIPINETVHNANTNDEASVGIGVHINHYKEDWSEMPFNDRDGVTFRVALTANTRKGITYDYIGPYTYVEWINAVDSVPGVTGDNSGAWLDIELDYGVRFYGGPGCDCRSGHYNKVWVCSNGFLSFDSEFTDPPDIEGFPDPEEPNSLLAVHWADLRVDEQAEVTYYSDLNVFCVCWKNVLNENNGERQTFEVIIKNNRVFPRGQNVIQFLYQDVTWEDSHAIVGIEDQEGYKGTFPFGSFPSSGQYIEFKASKKAAEIKRLKIKIEKSDPNALIDIDEDPDRLRGINIILDNNNLDEYLLYEGAVSDALTLLMSCAIAALLGSTAAGIIFEISLIGIEGAADYVREFSPFKREEADIENANTNQTEAHAYVKAEGNWGWPVDAAIGAQVHWVFTDDHTEDHSIRITAELEYTYYDENHVSYDGEISTSVNLAVNISTGGGGGGCPYLYTWDSERYVMDNNLLPAAEHFNGADVEDYYRLEQLLVPKYQGRRRSVYSLQIREFEQEHDYFDQVKLLAVDHSSDVNVAVTPYGEILTYSNPVPPVSAVDEAGADVLSLLSSVDGDYYQGYNGSYVTITFASTDISNGAKLVIRDDWPPYFEKCPVYVQVLNATGEWDTIAVFHTRAKWATDIINMAGHLPDVNGDLKVRLCFVSNDKIDYVGLDTTPQQDYKTRKAILIYAEHSEDGPVTLKLLKSDDKYAELVPGEQIRLTFLLPNNQNQERTFILYTEGHYNTIP